MAQLGVRRAAAYRRVAACIERGLLERLDPLRHEPSLIRATPAGLRYAGLGLPVAAFSPAAFDHCLRCATTAQLLAEEFGPERVLSERELRAAERLEGRPIASAKLGQLPSGHPRLHRPDLVVLPAPATDNSASDWGRARPSSSRTQGPRQMEGTRPPGRGSEGGRLSVLPGPPEREQRTDDRLLRAPAPPDARARPEDLRCQPVRASEAQEARLVSRATEMRLMPIAVEVELTPKSASRLLSIIRAWRGANWVAEVRYYCEPGPTRRGVEAAIAKAHAEKKVHVLEAVAR